MDHVDRILRIGVGGPVGSGKTALVDAVCKRMRGSYEIAVVTNDIYTKEDQEFLIRSQALAAERIVGVETGGCPHTAIREDASINLVAVDELIGRIPHVDFVMIESGGDNLSATFSPELADLTIYVIDLAPHVGASLDVMGRDARKMRGARPFVFSNLKTGEGLDEICGFIVREGMLSLPSAR